MAGIGMVRYCGKSRWGIGVRRAAELGAAMEKTGVFLAVLMGLVTLTSSANASNCRSIADPMKRLACYDKAESLSDF